MQDAHTGLAQSYRLPPHPSKPMLRHKEPTVSWFRPWEFVCVLPTLSFHHLNRPPPPFTPPSRPHSPSHHPRLPEDLTSPPPTTPGNTSQNRAWGTPKEASSKRCSCHQQKPVFQGPSRSRNLGPWLSASPTHVIIREREREGVNP